jgi:hypothetical protein
VLVLQTMSSNSETYSDVDEYLSDGEPRGYMGRFATSKQDQLEDMELLTTEQHLHRDYARVTRDLEGADYRHQSAKRKYEFCTNPSNRIPSRDRQCQYFLKRLNLCIDDVSWLTEHKKQVSQALRDYSDSHRSVTMQPWAKRPQIEYRDDPFDTRPPLPDGGTWKPYPVRDFESYFESDFESDYEDNEDPNYYEEAADASDSEQAGASSRRDSSAGHSQKGQAKRAAVRYYEEAAYASDSEEDGASSRRGSGVGPSHKSQSKRAHTGTARGDSRAGAAGGGASSGRGRSVGAPSVRKEEVGESCPDCGKLIGRARDMQRHRETCSGTKENMFLCEYCKQPYKLENAMWRHQRENCKFIARR